MQIVQTSNLLWQSISLSLSTISLAIFGKQNSFHQIHIHISWLNAITAPHLFRKISSLTWRRRKIWSKILRKSIKIILMLMDSLYFRPNGTCDSCHSFDVVMAVLWCTYSNMPRAVIDTINSKNFTRTTIDLP